MPIEPPTPLGSVTALPIPSGTEPVAKGREPDDRELAARLRRGDPQALERLYNRYSGVVLALLLKIVGNRQEAEDLLQEVFLHAWRRAPEYDPQRGSFTAWILTIARTRAIDALRSPRLRDRDKNKDRETDKGEVDTTPEDWTSLKERAEAVQRALSDLSEVQRQAIELAYYGGLSHAEISQRTGEPLGTVKSRISQAAARLRQALAQLGG